MAKSLSEFKVAAIGGGTGLSTTLRGIKKYTPHITAIVTVSDNGGSSGVLRQEMNMIPPGDIRNCLVALANTEPIMQDLLQYRFKEGSFKGQNFGNLFLAALSDVAGSFEKAVKVTSKVLAITGNVLPVTCENVELSATFENGVCIQGECEIVDYGKREKVLIKEIKLIPSQPMPSEEVITSLENADIIILGPGSLYTSIIPNLLVDSVAQAIKNAKAKKIYVTNIMSQPGETTGFSIEDHIRVIERYLGKNTIDMAVVNTEHINQKYIDKYIEDGADILHYNKQDSIWQRVQCIEAPLISINHEKKFIRHDSDKLAEYIFKNIE